jgi:hypothetical protein
MPESAQHVAPYGDLGQYLHEYRYHNNWYMDPDKGFYDLGDIAALLDPDLACWQETECPEVGWDLGYRFTEKMGSILRCYHVDRDRTFSLLYERLEQAYG